MSERRSAIGFRHVPGLAALCLLVACGTADESGGGPILAGDAAVAPDASLPVDLEVVGVTAVESPNSRLAAMLTVETSAAVTLTVDVASDDHALQLAPTGEATALWEVAVLGLRAGRVYTISVTATGADGQQASGSAVFETRPLPDDFPPIDVTVSQPSMMQPGWTVFAVGRWTEGADSTYGLIIALDEEGEVVWYYRADYQLQDVSRMADGNLVCNRSDDSGLVIIDPLGNELRQWRNLDLGLDSVHHDAHEMPGGNLTVLSSELRNIGGYTDALGLAVSYDVVGDVVAEFDPITGDVVEQHSLLDVLDPLRTAEGFQGNYWNDFYVADAPGGTKDWTHGNAVVYDGSDDTYIVSLRHQDWVVKIARETAALVWRLGFEGDFDLTVGGLWPYHQHAPMLGPEGTLLMFDNGNGRPGEAPGTYFSRAVEYTLDTSGLAAGAGGKGVATQVWEFRDETSFYSPFLGDADFLDNGNVLITDGGRVSSQLLTLTDPLNIKSARIVEVTHDAGSKKVFEVLIEADGSGPAVGYSVYRADRIDPLVP